MNRTPSPISNILFICVIAVLLVSTIGNRAWGNGFAYHGISTQALLAGLRHPHPHNRAEAARSLGIRQEKAAVEPLLGRLQDEQERDAVKHAVLDALGRIGDSRVLQPIIKVLQHEGSAEVRASAAQALGQFSEASARHALLDALQTERKIHVQVAVIRALGRSRHEQTVSALLELLRTSPHSTLQTVAIQSLGQLKNQHATQPLITILQQIPSPNLRREIVKSLGMIGDPQAVKPLLAMMQREHSDLVLKSITIVALGQIGDPLAVETLLDALDPQEFVMRLRVIEALGKIGHRKASKLLLNLLQQRLAATASLATERIEQTFADHMSLLHEQTAIVQALGHIQDPQVARGLRQALAMRVFPQDSAEGLRLRQGIYQRRRAAMVALSQLKAAGVVDTFVGLLQDRDGQIRAEAARLLSDHGDAQSVRPLIAALQDTQDDVRLEAARALGKLGARQAVIPLISRLQDTHALVREQAVLALGRLRDQRAIEALKVLQQRNTDARVEQALVYTLGQSQAWK
jgi:HEAT repeat protein